jgi:membrane protein YqaA with SNARE-associated domain
MTKDYFYTHHFRFLLFQNLSCRMAIILLFLRFYAKWRYLAVLTEGLGLVPELRCACSGLCKLDAFGVTGCP